MDYTSVLTEKRNHTDKFKTQRTKIQNQNAISKMSNQVQIEKRPFEMFQIC